MKFKFYNPTPKEFKFRFEETVVAIPALSFYVASSDVAGYVQEHYATIEVSLATEAEYLAFRKEEEEREKSEKTRLETLKKAEEKEAKKEAKLGAEKSAKAEEASKSEAEAKKTHLKKVKEDELKTIEAVEKRLGKSKK